MIEVLRPSKLSSPRNSPSSLSLTVRPARRAWAATRRLKPTRSKKNGSSRCPAKTRMSSGPLLITGAVGSSESVVGGVVWPLTWVPFGKRAVNVCTAPPARPPVTGVKVTSMSRSVAPSLFVSKAKR
jgi:hypothetical protein